MSLKSKIIAAATSAAAVFAFSTFAAAQETKPQTEDGQKMEKKAEFRKRDGFGRRGFGKGMQRGMRGGMKGGMKGGMHSDLRGIQLTDAQKQQIKAIKDSNRPSDADREAMRQKMQAFREAKRAGTLTEEQKGQIKGLQEERRAKMQRVHEQILGVLTPEQRQQLETRKQEMRQRMQQRREFRRPNKPNKPADKPANK